ncbi:OLC1v1036821C1 [Oldenlandia corymbosa var. corymbosa]|uniref:OLC1v1036821C1 n=1 Tax=Oldenlandia corymbosa var. corymbosa TaxID=529605 RepID=A0AAV1CWB2_OLDCO|nr:OLC1v1036821C1 [Oldenlandia corymbosa var. corymbosa]
MAQAAGNTDGADPVVEEMGRLEIQSGFPQVLLRLELRFLMRYLGCLFRCREAEEDVNLNNALESFRDILEEDGFYLEFIPQEEMDTVFSCLSNRFEQLEPKLRKICFTLLDSFESMCSSSNEILRVMDALIEHFLDLDNLKPDVILSFNNKSLIHSKKLIFLRNLVDVSEKTCFDRETLLKFLDYVKKDWVQSSARLSLWCLINGKNEPTLSQGFEAAEPEILLDQQKKFMFGNPEVAKMIIRLLTASKPSKSDTVQTSEVVVGFVAFLLEGLAAGPLKDCVEILKGDLIFMITFWVDQNAADRRRWLRVKVVLNEVISLILSLYMDELEVVDISSLQVKIEKLKLEIRELLYVPFFKSLDLNFPMANAMGYIDFFQENLKEMVNNIAFGKDQVLIIQVKLISFKPFLKCIMDLQNAREDLRYLWRRIVNLVFLAEHVISSCLVKNHPIWYDMLRLSDVIQEIKLIEVDVKRYGDYQMYDNRLATSCEAISSSHAPTSEVNTSSLEDDIMDLKDESMAIIEKLIWGTKGLHIVAVVGMPGLGKTTIAKRVYNDPSIVHHFRKLAWCCVSQVYKRRELYLDILTDVTGADARQSYSGSSEDDLAEKLWKCLRQQKYLIVLDDVWNIDAWERIKQSFPDDNVGSRILITSRIQNLMAQGKVINCSVHPLRFLSDEESWGIMKGKLLRFHSSPLDDELSEIAKNIAKHCRGLPLSVVLVAGVLVGKRKEFWKQIECSTSSRVVSEMCMDVLELSYKHLPDYLKPCFLYFGAFQEDTVVRAGKLMTLWIAEGLIPRNDRKISLYRVAEKYLSDLISRSLVFGDARSTSGEIKTCRVHDLLHDLCLAKTQEDNFLHWVHYRDLVSSQSSSNSKKYENCYRMCIDAEWEEFVNAVPASPFVHSLLAARQEPIHVTCPSIIFNRFKLLNVLDLECISIDCPFPEEVTLIVHLRYLAIHLYAAKIPPSIANLWNLEVFILRLDWSRGFSLPSTFWRMKSLRHVSFPLWRLTYGLENYEYGRLDNLEILAAPFLQLGNETDELLRKLPRLRKLKCYFPFISESDSRMLAEMSHLTHLQSLNVLGCGIAPKGEKWCQFIAFDLPCSLRKLSLKECKLPWSGISKIGELPNLEVLKLRTGAFSGTSWHAEDGKFSKLKYLELHGLDIEEWSVEDDPFPCLEQLIVKCCGFLCEIPSDLGNIINLKKILIHECDRASNSAREIFEEQRENGNDFLEVVVDDEYLKQQSE